MRFMNKTQSTIFLQNHIPANASYLINVFETAGYEAYLVGGCVRDSILGKTPKDWDICTSATPDQMIQLVDQLIKLGGHTFSIIETGLKHGTLTIGVDHDYFEVTTFRIDGQYEDCRRPSSVSFTTSLEEDLARRDFTINAIAFSPSKGIIDPYNGIQDIQDKIIRCVGSPSMRFNEDGLRILRALRFSAQLKFYIHPDTSSAIIANKCLLDRISKERIHSELIKIICSEQCGTQILRSYVTVFYQVIPAIKPMVGFKQNNPYHIYDVWEHTLHCMQGFPSTSVNMDELVIRLSLLFHDIGKPYCYSQDKNHIGHFYGHAISSADIAYNTLKDLKFSNEIIHNVVEIVANHDRQIVPTKPCLKKILNKLGEAQMWRLLIVRASDLLGQEYKINIERHHELEQVFALYYTILNQKECFSIKDLDMNGDDLIALGIPEGKEIGRILNTLLQAVIDEKVENKYVPLLNYMNDNIYKLGDESND